MVFPTIPRPEPAVPEPGAQTFFALPNAPAAAGALDDGVEEVPLLLELVPPLPGVDEPERPHAAAVTPTSTATVRTRAARECRKRRAGNVVSSSSRAAHGWRRPPRLRHNFDVGFSSGGKRYACQVASACATLDAPGQAAETIEIESEVENVRTGSVAALSTMDTSASDVRELREALRRALGNGRDAVPRLDAGWRDGWPRVADLGITALCVSESRGGFGFRVDAAAGAAMEFGAALHGTPFAGLTAGMHALSQAHPPPGDGLLSRLLTGVQICAFGQLRAGESVARLVDGAVGADALLLADGSGSLILLQDHDDWDVDRARHPFDVTRDCADVTVKAGAGHRLQTDGSPGHLYRLLLSADAVGGVQQMLDRTVDYSLQRRAFGHPIGGFQAVQHRLADHALRARGMTLLVEEAARLLAAGSPDAERAVAMAEVSVSTSAGQILHDLLQLTGAIGFTWEYGLHYYSRRAHISARLAANPKAAVRSLAELEGWIDAG